mmetsp:Transcript_22618/g.33477  ORF Transcript_22618/g.33477 Transcript_22618/m.33477 type:complete len:82 (+) Transcript_22618:43-288(+)
MSFNISTGSHSINIFESRNGTNELSHPSRRKSRSPPCPQIDDGAENDYMQREDGKRRHRRLPSFSYILPTIFSRPSSIHAE